ncbi:unnamed protein product [Symbiodinium sp. CCMP2592]|nr:unnamed protein product [Symbiodinium sp. CCMP2592]
MADLFDDDMSDEGMPSDLSDFLASDHEKEDEAEKKAKKKKDKKGDKKEVPVRDAKDNKKPLSGGDKKPGALAYALQDQHGNEVVGHSFSQVQLLKLQGLITHHCETLVCDLCGERAVILCIAKLTLVVCEQQSQQGAGRGYEVTLRGSRLSAERCQAMTIRPAGPLWASWKICTVDDLRVKLPHNVFCQACSRTALKSYPQSTLTDLSSRKKREPQFADEFGKARAYHLNPDMIRSFREEELDKVKRTGSRIETYFIFYSMAEFEQTFGVKPAEHTELSHLITTEEDEYGNEMTGVLLRDPERLHRRLVRYSVHEYCYKDVQLAARNTLRPQQGLEGYSSFQKAHAHNNSIKVELPQYTPEQMLKKAEELKKKSTVAASGSVKPRAEMEIDELLESLASAVTIIEAELPTPGLALPVSGVGLSPAEAEETPRGKGGKKKRKDQDNKVRDKEPKEKCDKSKPSKKPRKDDDSKSGTSRVRGQDAMDKLIAEHKANLSVSKVLSGTVTKQQLYFISKFMTSLEKKGLTADAADLERDHAVCTAALMLTPAELSQIPLEQDSEGSEGTFDVVHPMLKDCNHTSMADKVKIFEKAFLGKILTLIREGKEGQEKLAQASQCGARCVDVLTKSASGMPVADGYANAQASVRQALTSLIGLVAISSNGFFSAAGNSDSGAPTSASSGPQVLSSNAVKSLSDEKNTTSVLYTPLVCSWLASC